MDYMWIIVMFLSVWTFGSLASDVMIHFSKSNKGKKSHQHFDWAEGEYILNLDSSAKINI